MTPLRITLSPDARMPTRGSAGSSGYDLYAPCDILIHPGQIVVIHSGVSLELPDGWEAQVRPRSSMSKRGLWGAWGTIDSDYRGVVGATIANLTSEDARILTGERFAQLVFARVEHVAMEAVQGVAATVRGDGGFGSTGK